MPGRVRLPAQLRPQPVAELPSAAALELLLRKLDSSGTFMETAAHPDDEDNALLAMFSHGAGMRTVLVSATRGDGGQNEIGPELFQALGVLRTEELLAAHRFDGAEQYFTRARDFGYSFSIDETLEKWGHDEILGDFVRHIRTIRPDVIAGFLCSGEGGGQHHQASARLTREAFRAAGDPGRYPEQAAEGLRPWQARRVFCTDVSGFGPPRQQPPRTPDLLTVDVSGFDPVLGRTYAEIGVAARSMHKCQGMPQLLGLPGQAQNRTYRQQDTVDGDPDVAPRTMFEGIDTTLAGLVRFAPGLRASLTPELGDITAHVAAARRALSTAGPGAAAPPLATGLAGVRALRQRLGGGSTGSPAEAFELDFRLAQKEAQFEQALVIASGVRLDALADDGAVMPGQRVTVSLYGASTGADDVTVRELRFGGVAVGRECIGSFGQGTALRCKGELAVAPDARVTSPYWTPREDAARDDFAPGVPFGVPFAPTPFTATFGLTIAGAEITVERPIQFRYDDIMAGEKRMELHVVPAFSAVLAPGIVVIPAGDRPSRDIDVTLTNQTRGPASVSVSLQVPSGWSATPRSAPVKFSREDEQVTVTFAVTAAPGAVPGEFTASAVLDAQVPRSAGPAAGYQVVEYPHVHRRHATGSAKAQLKLIDVDLPPQVRVGYITGVGDAVPQAIQQLGADLHLITPRELGSGDLSAYDVIVTGVRAYERRADLRANNHRLIAYAEQGGTVLVQYNKFEFNEAQYGPYLAKVGSARITDEQAPVTVLAPGHQVFTWPNHIDSSAWAGWVQERGLYFLGERDSRYVDLVRMEDPFDLNKGAKTGALVEASVGKGRWIYIGLGLWRQLPAGTDGAYKLLANLLSLSRRPAAPDATVQ